MSILAILGIALALSLAGNAGLGWLLKDAWQDAATAQSAYEQAKAAGVQCSEGVAKLAIAGAAREKAAKDALRAAQGARAAADARALQTLQVAPSKPDDLCASASELNASKLAARNK